MRKKNSPYRWQSAVIVGTIIISLVFALGLVISSPDTFIIKVVSENGDVSWSLNNEKLYDVFIQSVAAWGTIMVGVIALGQSENSHKLAEKIASRENSCNVLISNYGTLNLLDNGSTLSNENNPKYEEVQDFIYLTFDNHSDAFLKSIDILFGEVHFRSHLTLVKGKAKSFMIRLPKGFDLSNAPKCNIVFTSCNNELTYGDFDVTQAKKIQHYHFYGIENVNGVEL